MRDEGLLDSVSTCWVVSKSLWKRIALVAALQILSEQGHRGEEELGLLSGKVGSVGKFCIFQLRGREHAVRMGLLGR